MRFISLFALILTALLLNSCGVGGPGFGVTATISDQGQGIKHVAIAPHPFKTRGKAIEAFHYGAQKSQSPGSYRYQLEVMKKNQARNAATGLSIPYGLGAGAALGVLAGNVAVLNQEKPAVYSVSGYTYPQLPAALGNSRSFSLQVVPASDTIEPISNEHLRAIKVAAEKTLSSLGYSNHSKAKRRLRLEVFRAAQNHPWTTLELSLLPNPSRKAFLFAKTKKGNPVAGEFDAKLKESLNHIVSVR